MILFEFDIFFLYVIIIIVVVWFDVEISKNKWVGYFKLFMIWRLVELIYEMLR